MWTTEEYQQKWKHQRPKTELHFALGIVLLVVGYVFRWFFAALVRLECGAVHPRPELFGESLDIWRSPAHLWLLQLRLQDHYNPKYRRLIVELFSKISVFRHLTGYPQRWSESDLLPEFLQTVRAYTLDALISLCKMFLSLYMFFGRCPGVHEALSRQIGYQKID